MLAYSDIKARVEHGSRGCASGAWDAYPNRDRKGVGAFWLGSSHGLGHSPKVKQTLLLAGESARPTLARECGSSSRPDILKDLCCLRSIKMFPQNPRKRVHQASA